MTTVVVPWQHFIHIFDGINNNLNFSYSSNENSIYLDKRHDRPITSFIIGALICRHMEWSSVAFGAISVPSSPLWSHLRLVTAFHGIYEVSVCVLQRDQWTGLQRVIKHAIVRENLNFLNGAHPRLSVTLHDLDVHGHRWQQGDLTSPSWLECWWLCGAAPPRVNTGLCLCSRSLPGERKYLKLEPSA